MTEVGHRLKHGKGRPTFDALVAADDMETILWKLTDKQKTFITEYMVDFNAAGAARRAGYPSDRANKQGFDLMEHPGIKYILKKNLIERAEKSPIKPEYVLTKIMRVIEQADHAGQHNAVLKGCELLARHLGMFVERQEISGPEGGAIKYEQVREAADAFTSAISSLIDRAGTGEVPSLTDLRDEGRA